MVDLAAPPDPREPAGRGRWASAAMAAAWIAAVAGWAVSAALLAYSHGLSDRVRVTRVNAQKELAGVKGQLAKYATLRDYLTSPDLRILPLKNWVSATSKTRVELITRQGSSQGIVLADKLAAPPSGEIYVIWLKPRDQRYRRIGTFTTNPAGEGIAQVNSTFPLGDFPLLAISVEPSPVPRMPTSAMLFTVSLSTPRPEAAPTSVPTATTTPVPIVRLPRLP